VIKLLNIVHTDKLKLLFLWWFLGLEWIRYFAKRIIHIVILIILSHKSIIPHLILLIHKVKKQLIPSRDISSLRKSLPLIFIADLSVKLKPLLLHVNKVLHHLVKLNFYNLLQEGFHLVYRLLDLFSLLLLEIIVAVYLHSLFDFGSKVVSVHYDVR
jgi:hypothetical protein